MRTIVAMLIAVGLLPAAGPLLQQSGFETGTDDWRAWTARPETSARLFVDAVHNRAEPGSLAVSGNSNPAVCGGWERVVEGISAGQWYKLVAHYRGAGVDYEPRQVVARLDWSGPSGKRVGQPEYAYQSEPAGDWTRLTLSAPAPEKATSVRIQLMLWDAPQATLWWDEISLTPVAEPAPRKVKVASVNLRPLQTGSAKVSVEKFIQTIDAKLDDSVDLIVLPEGVTIVGTGKSYGEVAEPVPGPTTDMLGDVARRHSAYIAAGIYEREGNVIYNTAVLIDREGRLVGRYRKVYLPREETEGGMKPGASYPVFETDFGKVGMMICWDVQYADPARALALGGAEMILMPIWGGNTVLADARAIENHVFLVSSGYDHPTRIVDPQGKVLAEADDEGTVAVATVDLNKRYVDKWLGNMRARYMRELRLDVPVMQR